MYKFSDVFEFQNKSKLKAGEGKSEGKYPFYTSSVDLSKYVDEALFNGESLVFGTGGNASVHYAQGKFSVSTDCLVAQPKIDNINTRFVYYYLFGNIRILEQGFRGAGLKHISKNYISNIVFPEFPRSKQDEIVQILNTAETLRQKRRDQLSFLDDYLKSVFLEMFGDPVKNVKKWPIKNFGDIYHSIRYGTGSPPEYQLEGIPFIRATNIKDGTVAEKDMKYISHEDAKKIEKCKLTTGNLIIVRSGVNTGDCGLIPSKYNEAYAAYDLIVELPFISSVFYNHLINSAFGKCMIKPLTRRAGQPHLNAEQVGELRFIYPPEYLQQKFADIVKKVEQLRQKQKKSEKELNNLFNSLMQKAFKEELN